MAEHEQEPLPLCVSGKHIVVLFVGGAMYGLTITGNLVPVKRGEHGSFGTSMATAKGRQKGNTSRL